MKMARMLVVCFAVSLIPAMAQNWELGGTVGGGFYTSQDVTAPGASASAKIQSNFAGSTWLANNSQGRWGGELRYDYQRGALQLSGSGMQATFGAESHAAHYDFVWHGAPSTSKIKPFLAVGAGVKVYRGTGTEVVYQPLSNLALLTKARDLTPLISVGGGFRIPLTPHTNFQVEVHDYMTSFPTKVITPNTGAKVGGWLQDFVPMAGITYVFGRGE